MIDYEELTLFIYVAARMSGFVLFNPIFGRRNIPGIFKSGLILVLAISTISVTEQSVAVPETTLQFMVTILLELCVGLLLGMVVSFFFYIPQLAGETIDTQMAMTMNQIYDPGSQANLSTTGIFLNTMMMLIFFAANGHHTLIQIMMTSGDVVAFGTAVLPTGAAQAMLVLFVECTVLAVKLAMPILAAELVGQIGMGILMKVIPQINVFAINIDLKVIIGLAMLLILVAPMGEFLLTAEMQMLESLRAFLAMTAG